jgi:DNA-binding response OmpR family regulator
MTMSSPEAPRPRCLIVEDQALIAMAIEAYLEDMGYRIGGPFGSRSEALAYLERDTPQVAILDYMLGDGPTSDLAEELKRRGIPFVVYSGRSRDAAVSPAFAGVPWLEKPVGRSELVSAIASAQG